MLLTDVSFRKTIIYMPYYHIQGGHALHGNIRASGNKNSALPCLAASLLSEDPVTLHNVPDIEDVQVMIRIIRSLGIETKQIHANTYQIHAAHVSEYTVAPELARSIRASILFAPPLLIRKQKAVLHAPGGDVIGIRRLDTHFLALQSLGVHVNVGPPFEFTADVLTGTDIFLDEASVTATENAIMLAVLSKGNTIIENAACEPHVQDLCHMLCSMGADIKGIGSNMLYITGVTALHGTDFSMGTDFMEVGSFIGLAVTTHSELRIHNVQPTHLKMIRHMFAKLGVYWDYEDDILCVSAQQKLKSMLDLAGNISKIDDAPWPGFPPDLISIATVIATQTEGTVLIHEKMFESRMFFVDKLISMGAHIVLCDPHRAVVSGPASLSGTELSSPDVRAGMALLIAALCAQGESRIHNIYQIDRGYEHIHTRLKTIGAHIELVT
ncbi:hypothetical protein LSH36_583g01241 [Paralvinella palmiformis]|uniref:UDP-N-acetylglucosamine 1-carboxyvinyltransferase n=1 Tax=Paralvinella palmiformis TaxID=53620 RepID=A0AAD9MVC0_9ANNE|nr:hypothetical protein LSH36_583g01241 [Paralvinella palmiformis]